jgi:fermentation-respiration switch protein FrsA (DUF1100 family)
MWRGLCILAAASTMGGCATQMAADPSRFSLRPVYPGADSWPAPASSPTGRELSSIDWVVETEARSAGGPRTELIRHPVYTVEFCARFGAGTVRELRRLGERRPPRHGEVLLDVQVPLRDKPSPREYSASLREHAEREFTIVRSEGAVTGLATPGIDLAALDEPERYGALVDRLVRDRAVTFVPPAGPARGLIVRLRSFAENPFEESVVEEFRRRGWAVLSASFATPLVTVGRYDLGTGSALKAIARTIARDVDLVCAERAYTVEAAMDWLAARHPEVPRHPAAIVGFSAGALGVPTVAARMPARFDAAVMVCAGADLLSIAQRNPMARIGLSVTMAGRDPPPPALERLSAGYLAASSLDPYATATALTCTPVLMIHGARDREVPADLGDLLYGRLGRPERWVFDGGHAWVFLQLPRIKGEIARWVERAGAVQ